MIHIRIEVMTAVTLEQLQATLQLQMDGISSLLQTAVGAGASNNHVRGLGKVTYNKPDKFSGSRADFRLWLRELGTWARNAYPHARSYIDWAIARNGVITDKVIKDNIEIDIEGSVNTNAIDFSRDLCGHLKDFLDEDGKRILLNCPDEAGLEVLRQLSIRFDPKGGIEQGEALLKVVRPSDTICKDLSRLLPTLETWEMDRKNYLAFTSGMKDISTILPENVQVIIAISICPDDLRIQLMKELHKYPTYSDLKTELISYINRVPGATKRELGNINDNDDHVKTKEDESNKDASDYDYEGSLYYSSKGGFKGHKG